MSGLGLVPSIEAPLLEKVVNGHSRPKEKYISVPVPRRGIAFPNSCSMPSHGKRRGSTHFIPKHCLDPLLKATRFLRRWTALGCSQRSGAKMCPLGKMVGLLCCRTEVMPTGVCIYIRIDGETAGLQGATRTPLGIV